MNINHFFYHRELRYQNHSRTDIMMNLCMQVYVNVIPYLPFLSSVIVTTNVWIERFCIILLYIYIYIYKPSLKDLKRLYLLPYKMDLKCIDKYRCKNEKYSCRQLLFCDLIGMNNVIASRVFIVGNIVILY
jgi:hypothetical protein